MLSDEFLEREMRAFDIISGRVREMIKAGYDIRVFEQPTRMEYDLVFIGPGTAGPDIQTLRIPYHLLSMLVASDRESNAELRAHVDRVSKANSAMLGFVIRLIGKKMGEWRNGNDNGTGKKEFQA